MMICAACAPRVSLRAPPPVQEISTATISEPSGKRETNALAAEEPPLTEPRWYGWQNAIAAGGGVALVIAGLGVNSESRNDNSGVVVLAAGALTYIIGPAIVHFAHHNIGQGFGSILMLTLGPLMLGTVGSIATSAVEGSKHCDFWCPSTGTIIGLFAGLIAGPIIDAGLIAYEEPPR